MNKQYLNGSVTFQCPLLSEYLLIYKPYQVSIKMKFPVYIVNDVLWGCE